MTTLRHALEDERHTTVAEGDPPALAGPHDWLIANLRANGLLREAEAVRELIAALAAAPAVVVGEPVAQGEPVQTDTDSIRRELFALAARDVITMRDRVVIGAAISTLSAPPARQALTKAEVDAIVYASREAEEGPTAMVQRIERACADAWGVTLVGIGGKGGANG